LTLNCAHVTDEYVLVGSGATATASVQGGVVTSIQVTNQGSGYSHDSTLPVFISGGGGQGALAQGSTSLFEATVSVNVLYGGSGYTSAPNVDLPSSGSAQANVVSFCAQTGDIGMNHGCVNTYVPYLAKLAAGFA